MDLDEWELLPNDGLLEIHDHRSKPIFFENFPSQFVDSTEHSRVPNQLVPLQIQLEPNIKQFQEDDEVTKEVITMVPNSGAAIVEDEHDQVSQVYFKKMKETEFENMKLDSPKFNNKTCTPHIDAGTLQFKDKDEVLEVDKEMMIKKRDNMEKDFEESNTSRLNLWSWSLTGIGAICSLGVAASIYIMIGNHQKKKQDHKLKFQFSDDKKMKQVVQQQPTRLDEAISGARGGGGITRKLTVEGLLLSSLEHIQECLSVS